MHHKPSVPEPVAWALPHTCPPGSNEPAAHYRATSPYQQHQDSATLSAMAEQFLRELSMQRDNPSTTGIRHNNYSSSLTAESPLHVIDLFCGCGGFSLGLARAGFQILAAIDLNAEAILTYQKNLPQVPHVLQKDLTSFQAHELNEMIGETRVDVIVGGPPCQGFSTVRQRDGANHGQKRLIDDKRRYLYQEFLRYVEHFRPRVFVMENVLGIRSAADGKYFTKVQEEARQLGYRVHSQIEDA
jgi:methylase of polypeptide subunit release factors